MRQENKNTAGFFLGLISPGEIEPEAVSVKKETLSESHLGSKAEYFMCDKE